MPDEPKTIPEMFRDQQTWHDRLVRSDKEKIVFKVRQFQERCTECGAPTVEVAIPLAADCRICVQCLINELDQYESEVEDDVRYDMEELEEKLERAIDEFNESQAINDRLTRDLEAANAKVKEKMELIGTICKECDDLRARVEAFDDDSMALKNQNARLLMDIQELRRRGGNKR